MLSYRVATQQIWTSSRRCSVTEDFGATQLFLITTPRQLSSSRSGSSNNKRYLARRCCPYVTAICSSNDCCPNCQRVIEHRGKTYPGTSFLMVRSRTHPLVVCFVSIIALVCNTLFVMGFQDQREAQTLRKQTKPVYSLVGSLIEHSYMHSTDNGCIDGDWILD